MFESRCSTLASTSEELGSSLMPVKLVSFDLFQTGLEEGTIYGERDECMTVLGTPEQLIAGWHSHSQSH